MLRMGPNPRPDGARETTSYCGWCLVFDRTMIMASITAAIGITVSATLAQPKWLSIWNYGDTPLNCKRLNLG